MRVSVTTLLFLSSLATATDFTRVKHVEDQSHLLARRAVFSEVKHADGRSQRLAKRDEFKKVKHTDQSHLLVRQFESCTGVSCASCFGPGNIVCEGSLCFNPRDGEQCCGDGTYCVGSDDSCCGSAGAGTSYDDSEPTDSSPTPTETDSSSPTDPGASSSTSSWSCSASDSVEECCARGGSTHKWCSGDGDIIPMECFDPSADEECCEAGFTCAGSGCCATVNESAVTPTPSTAAFLGTAGGDSGFTDSLTNTDTFDLGGSSTAFSGGSQTTTTSSGSVTPVSGGGSGSGNGVPAGLSAGSSLGPDMMLYITGVMSFLALVLVL